MGRFSSLAQWLEWQEGLHPREIDLGLERVGEVLARLGYQAQAPFALITLAGTNGKGSTQALIEAMLVAAGYRVGAYSSPHLLRYNERIRINGESVDDAQICDAFTRIDQQRADTSLTYFEFGTLAAIDIFHRHEVEVAVMEVGLGGRLDAVNLLDADVALITSVDLDHTDWLGPDLESIAREKAGILRPGRPCVFGGREPPRALTDRAEALQAPLYCYGRDYQVESLEGHHWRWDGLERRRGPLPPPALHGVHQLQNAAAALMALELLHERLPLGMAALRRGLQEARLPGRFQVLPGTPEVILDVAHNPAAVSVLADTLARRQCGGRTLAIWGCMADKQSAEMIAPLQKHISHWYPVDLELERAQSASVLAQQLREAGGEATPCADMATALARASELASAEDRLLVFGSFYTVAEALALLEA